jgi:hypothetical protein
VVIKEGTNQVVRSQEEKGKRGDYFWSQYAVAKKKTTRSEDLRDAGAR